MKNFGFLAAIALAVVAQTASAQISNIVIPDLSVTANISSLSKQANGTVFVKMSDGLNYTASTGNLSKISIGGVASTNTSLKVGMTCKFTSAKSGFGNLLTSMAC